MQSFIRIGAVSGAVVVALGAFGAHALKEMVSVAALGNWETAVKYQMFHTIGILIVALLHKMYSNKLLTTAGVCFLVGIFIFSGSLYILVLSGIKWLGAITPIGGVSFIIGWICLGLSFKKE
ncbi:MAG: DUF423 domain-containing protein [Bacilli bacterium]